MSLIFVMPKLDSCNGSELSAYELELKYETSKKPNAIASELLIHLMLLGSCDGIGSNSEPSAPSCFSRLL